MVVLLTAVAHPVTTNRAADQATGLSRQVTHRVPIQVVLVRPIAARRPADQETSEMKVPFFVAEMSANHMRDLGRALAIVDAAADAGADAVKLQTWEPDTMCLDRAHRINNGPWAGFTLFELYHEASLPWDFHKPIFDRCAKRGIECFSAPFDRASVDFLELLGCPRFKIASFELVDLDLIRYAASKGKPMILSTGMATAVEISHAYASAMCGIRDVTLLQCTSAYPSDARDANLAMMAEYRMIGAKAGLSDHTPGLGVAVAATMMGATMIEKHLTLSRADGGLDAGFSMEPAEFKQMVTECKRAAASVGRVKYGPSPSESTDLRRSLYFARDVVRGQRLMHEDMCTARPALGISPMRRGELIGQVVMVDAKAGSPITSAIIGNWTSLYD